MKSKLLVVRLAVVALAVGMLSPGAARGADTAPAPGGAPGKAGAVRVGTYDARAVAIAYANSPLHKGGQDLMDAYKKAEAAGDTAKAAELRARGSAMQTVRHLQAFGGAPIDDIMAAVKDSLPAIAREAGVAVITRATDYTAEGVETVDVTDRLVALIKPNERGRKWVAEIRRQKPMEWEAILVREKDEKRPGK